MTRKSIAALMALAIIAAAHTPAQPFPLGFSAGGGVGEGYYSMSGLNRHLGMLSQTTHVSISGLTKGVNFKAEGRLWLFDQVALASGYEHYWGETSAQGTSSSFSYSAPADVFTIGGIVSLLRIENVFSLCLGVNRCMAKSVFGMNESDVRVYSEFDGDGSGYEAYAEIHTGFIDPIEIGFQLGYRGLTIEKLNDKYGHAGYFEPGMKLQLDYSGVFFYLTSAIRI